MRGTTVVIVIVAESKGYSGRPGVSDPSILDLAKRVNGQGSDLLSFGSPPVVVTNLRDRVNCETHDDDDAAVSLREEGDR